MIAVLIVGVLSAIAYPSYTEYVRRGHRAEARTAMLDLAQFLQRFYSIHDRFDQTRDGYPFMVASAMAKVPATGEPRYRIVVADLTATSYRIEARPTGVMAGDPCGTFTLNSVGQRNVVEAQKTGAECWR